MSLQSTLDIDNRMHGDLFVHGLSNDIKIALQKNHIRGKLLWEKSRVSNLLYRSLDPG